MRYLAYTRLKLLGSRSHLACGVLDVANAASHYSHTSARIDVPLDSSAAAFSGSATLFIRICPTYNERHVRKPPGHKNGDVDDQLPLLPHQLLGDPDCCGCIGAVVEGDIATLVCNECEAVIWTGPLADVEQKAAEMAAAFTDLEWCSATCPGCRTVNVFLGWSSIEAFVCQHCGEGVKVEQREQ